MAFSQLSFFVATRKWPLLQSSFVNKHLHFQSMFSGHNVHNMLSSASQTQLDLCQWPYKLEQKITSSETKSRPTISIYRRYFLAIKHPVLRNQCLCYSKKSKSKQKSANRGEDIDNDDETDDEDEDDVNDSEEEEDEIDGEKKDWKDMKMNVPSLRIDAVLSSGLGVSRKKVEEAFLSGKLQHNGKKVMKKSRQVQEGDILDVVKENNIVNKKGNQVMLIMRVQMRKIKDEKTATDKTPVKLRRWKHLEIPKEK